MRILVLTDEASLAIALSQMPFGHDVVAIDAIEQLEGHDLSFQVAIVDFGSTRRGLVGASDVIRSGVNTPCLVVGDESPIELAVELAPDANVIVRPFSLEELEARLEELATLALQMRQQDVGSENLSRRALGQAKTALPPGNFRRRETQPRDREHQARVERTEHLLRETAQIERFLMGAPEVLEPRAVAERLLGTVEHVLRPLVSALWIPDRGGGYEALAARHLDDDARVSFDQSLFLSFETNLDAVLVVQPDPLQHPVAGIPGIKGGTFIAAALRTGDALQGVVMAAGDGYTEVTRDELQLLAAETAPALAVAEIFERLRSRQLPTPVQPAASQEEK